MMTTYRGLTLAALCLTSSIVFAQPPGNRPGAIQGSDDPEMFVTRLMNLDQNGDGKLSKEEVTDARLQTMLSRADADQDGSVSKEELTAAMARQMAARGPGGGGFGGRGPGGGGPGGPGGGPGFGPPPKLGQILPEFIQESLELTARQRKCSKCCKPTSISAWPGSSPTSSASKSRKCKLAAPADRTRLPATRRRAAASAQEKRRIRPTIRHRRPIELAARNRKEGAPKHDAPSRSLRWSTELARSPLAGPFHFACQLVERPIDVVARLGPVEHHRRTPSPDPISAVSPSRNIWYAEQPRWSPRCQATTHLGARRSQRHPLAFE